MIANLVIVLVEIVSILFFYQSIKPSKDDTLSFEKEDNNPYDSFAVAVKAKFPHKLVPITVGHVPIEISRIVYFSIGHGCSYKVKVLEEKPARSPLTQGGLEVKCSVTASWTNEKGITLLKKLVDEKYSFDKRLEDESADIIKKLFPDTTEQDDDDYFGYGLQLLEIYDSDEEGEDENIN